MSFGHDGSQSVHKQPTLRVHKAKKAWYWNFHSNWSVLRMTSSHLSVCDLTFPLLSYEFRNLMDYHYEKQLERLYETLHRKIHSSTRPAYILSLFSTIQTTLNEHICQISTLTIHAEHHNMKYWLWFNSLRFTVKLVWWSAVTSMSLWALLSLQFFFMPLANLKTFTFF